MMGKGNNISTVLLEEMVRGEVNLFCPYHRRFPKVGGKEYIVSFVQGEES
jgi:hypothetical protein